MGERRRTHAGVRPAFFLAPVLTLALLLLTLLPPTPSASGLLPAPNASSMTLLRLSMAPTWEYPLSQALSLPIPPLGVVLIVNTTSDEDNPGDGFCSLREAIINSNIKAGADSDCGAAQGNDTIKFTMSGTITLTSALPAIVNALTIDGTGQTIALDGANSYVLTVGPGATLHLNSLTVEKSGLTNEGTLIVTNSTFSNNNIFGGIYNSAMNGKATIVNSTFFSNGFDQGGAIFNNKNNTLSVTNCTFSGNSASPGGGGALFNSTNATLTVSNSILAGNLGGSCAPPGLIENGGGNISDDDTCGFPPSTGARGQSLGDNVDPKLEPKGLQDNGGPTKTIALEPTSPAIDAIPISSNLCPSTDQRGNPRPDPGESSTPACDSGAFESSEPPTPTPTPTPTSTPTPVPERVVVAGSGNFGTVVDGRTKTRSYRIKNVGTKKTGHSVTIAAESIMDTTAMTSPFSLLNTCAQVLAPGQSCGVAVKCAPTDSDTSTHTAVLDVFDNAAGSPQTVDLECTAKAPRGKAADEGAVDSEGGRPEEELVPFGRSW